MPELPEVETVCSVMRRALEGKRVTEVEVVEDPIVFGKLPAAAIDAALRGRTVRSVGRRGKYFWLLLGGEGPVVLGHLGMSGWVREVGKEGTRLHGHGKAPLDDADGRPRFLRLLLRTATGRGIAFTDPRRLGRIWLSPSIEEDKRVARLGPDALDELPAVPVLTALFARRSVSIKGVLLDQSALSGIGNWVADEVLYQSRIAPMRPASSLSPTEIRRLRRVIHRVLTLAVEVAADHTKFPTSWLFAHRWGGARGDAHIGKHPIVREEIAGRTTAWVPDLQR